MPANLVDRELGKFVETPAGATAVRTADENGAPLQAPGIGQLQTFNTTPAPAVGSGGPLADRRGLYIQPVANGLFLGFDASVDATTGIKLFQDTPVFIDAGENCPVYLVTAAGTVQARVWEVK